MIRHLAKMETLSRPEKLQDVNADLLESLQHFVQLYDQLKDNLRDAAEDLSLAATRGSKERRQGDGTVVLLSFLGGGLGALVGGVSGGLWGLGGAIGTMAYQRFFGHVDKVSASIGFLVSTFSGLMGGAFSGAVGCAIEVAAAASGRRIPSVVSRVLWLSIGGFTGGAIGSIYGRSVGMVGGAIGGGLGACHSRIVAIYIAAGTTDYASKEKDSSTEKLIGRRLSRKLTSLEAELKNIQRLCGRVELGDTLDDMAKQSARAKSAIKTLEKMLSDCETAEGSPQSAACRRDGARRCRETLKEMDFMTQEVKKVLAILENCDFQ